MLKLTNTNNNYLFCCSMGNFKFKQVRQVLIARLNQNNKKTNPLIILTLQLKKRKKKENTSNNKKIHFVV